MASKGATSGGTASSDGLNLFAPVQEYLRKMLDSVRGIKVLLLDAETSGIVGLASRQTLLLEKEVFLVADVSTHGQQPPMPHAACIVFVRPIQENITLLADQLRDPAFRDYYIFFSNTLKEKHLEEIARGDMHWVVKSVQEFFADYYPLRSELFTLNMPSVSCIESPSWDQSVFDRICDGVSSVLLALKRSPSIRYQHNSSVAEKLALEIQRRINDSGDLFVFQKQAVDPVLLILDRRDDPVTPLLTQWTYEAMVHDNLGIHNNRVEMGHVPGISPDLKEIVLSSTDDEIFRQCSLLNFGDLGAKLKELVDALSQQSSSKGNVQDSVASIDDLRRFVDAFPEIRRKSAHVAKHVALVKELSRLTEANKLMEVSELEQFLACHNDKSSAFKRILDMMHEPGVRNIDRLKLVLLYALRYEEDADPRDVKNLLLTLKEKGVPERDLKLPNVLHRYCGVAVRSQDLFGTSLVATASKLISRGLKGVENVYTQHDPLLKHTLSMLSQGRLREQLFPFVNKTGGRDRIILSRPRDVIVFMVGGATYEEARAVSLFNQSNPSVRVILGGTVMHNAESFLADIIHLVPTGSARPAAGGQNVAAHAGRPAEKSRKDMRAR